MLRFMMIMLILSISFGSFAQNKLLFSEFVESAFDVKSPTATDNDQRWILGVELGATMTTGNTDTQTYKAKLSGAYFYPVWRMNYFAQLLDKTDNGNKKVNKWKLGAKVNRDFSATNSSFATIEYEEDQFSQYDALATFSTGYTHRLYNKNNIMWDADVGPGVRWIKSDAHTKEQQVLTVLHLGTNLLLPLSKHAEFGQVIVSDIGLTTDSSTVIRSESTLTANVLDNLKMKFSYTMRHDSMPGMIKENLDTQTSLTLLMTF
ncbi:MAG: DUF481 domain-containing protein [Gammaproteobacteria bacterium]|nr:DUF481 domain-containing protein [Gammaproteobacteria bacterium]